MEKNFEDLYAEMEGALGAFQGSDFGVNRLSEILALVRKYLGLLRAEVEQRGFTDAREEIAFFKSVKPQFYQWMIFFAERYVIGANAPVMVEDRLQYYGEQLRFIGRFFRQHAFYYEYYRVGATDLDHLWFVRGAAAPEGFVLELPEVDPAFGTAQDYLFAKFRAYERLQQELLEELAAPVEGRGSGLTSRKGRELRWTGDSCNLVELVYGIFETGQVNEGKVDLSDLMDVFELVFQVNLSRYFRRFTEIKRRKTISKTKYLDEMRDAVNKRIADGDALAKPVRGARHPFLEGNKYL